MMNRRDKILGVRLSEQEMFQLENLANELKISKADLVRLAISKITGSYEVKD